MTRKKRERNRKQIGKLSEPDSSRAATQEEENRAPEQWLGSLLEMEGLGREHLKGVDPDEFVRKLREGWE